MVPRVQVHVVPLGALLALLACGGGSSPPPPFTPLILEKDAAYFSVGGKVSAGGREQFVASRNISGRSVAEVESLLDKAAKEGTRLVRFHVTHLGGPGITSSGEVVESWAADWDEVFDHARSRGICVLPVFGVWADWNDGSNGEAWHVWNLNPLNTANGGPAADPLELYTSGSAGQTAWLGWLGKLVTRWQKHDNVAAWEIFSELDLVTRGMLDAATFQSRGIAFIEAAAPVIRAADPSKRPVTASTGWWEAWFPALYGSDAVDVMQLHLYTPGGDLDAGLLSVVGSLHSLALPKPILVGESGLDWAAPDGTTATTAPEGPRATRHAVWAALVAGAMNGRALWWEDGYAITQNDDQAAVDFVTGYPAVEGTALGFMGDRDLAGMVPIGTDSPGAVVAGAIGDEQAVLGWARSGTCALTGAWNCSTDVSGITIQVHVPGTAGHWQATFYDPATGGRVDVPEMVTPSGSTVPVALPSFSDDIAFKLVAVP